MSSVLVHKEWTGSLGWKSGGCRTGENDVDLSVIEYLCPSQIGLEEQSEGSAVGIR